MEDLAAPLPRRGVTISEHQHDTAGRHEHSPIKTPTMVPGASPLVRPASILRPSTGHSLHSKDEGESMSMVEMARRQRAKKVDEGQDQDYHAGWVMATPRETMAREGAKGKSAQEGPQAAEGQTNWPLERRGSLLRRPSANTATAEEFIQNIMSNSIVRVEKDGRGFDLSSTEVQLLANNLGSNTQCTALTVGFCGLDDMAGKHIGVALALNTTLKTLNLWQNQIGPAGGEGLGEGTAVNTTLTEMNLRTNVLGPTGALGLAKGLSKNRGITILHLRYNNIGNVGAKAIAATLMQNSCLKEVDIGRNRISSEGAEALMKAVGYNQTLTHLNLQLNPISDKGGIAVGMALRSNAALEHLDLQSCEVGDRGAAAIFDCLGAGFYHHVHEEKTEKARRRRKTPSINHHVKYLNLSGNGIGEIGAVEAGLALGVNKGITTLDLSSNNIGDAGAASIAEALKINKTLVELSLAVNEIGERGAANLGRGLMANEALLALEIQKNKIPWLFDTTSITCNTSLLSLKSDLNIIRVEVAVSGEEPAQGFKVDISHAREEGGVDKPLDIFACLSKSLLSLHAAHNSLGLESVTNVSSSVGEYLNHAHSLCDLNLSNNLLRDEHVKALSFTSLTLLDLSHNQIGNAGAEHVFSLLSKVRGGSRLKELDFSDNQIHRIAPSVCYLTQLEYVYIEKNPVMSLVPLTAAQGGVRGVTQWLLRWAYQQIHLTDTLIGKKKEHESDLARTASSPTTATGSRSARVKSTVYNRSHHGGTDHVVAPSIRGFNTSAPRFAKAQDGTADDPTPGPLDYSPYARRSDGTEVDVWRASLSTIDKTYNQGPKLAKELPITREQEQAILSARLSLLDESFGGMTVLPSNWHSPRHPKIVDACKEEESTTAETFHLSLRQARPAGHDEQYGVESIRRLVQKQRPDWNLSAMQIVRCLKQSGVIHDDGIMTHTRPHYRYWDSTNMDIPGVVPFRSMFYVWESKSLFAEATQIVIGGKRGFQVGRFSDWLHRKVSSEHHKKNITAVRAKVKEFDWEDPAQRALGAVLIRNVLLETYVAFFKRMAYYDDNEMAKEVRRVIQSGGRRLEPDERSRRAEVSSKVHELFVSDPPKIDHIEPLPEHQLRPDIGPCAYKVTHNTIVSDPALGFSLTGRGAEPNATEPTPGPQDYNAEKPRLGGTAVIKEPVGKEPIPTGPGPLDYHIPDMFDKHWRTNPAQSLLSRAHLDYLYRSEAGTNPGPGAYDKDVHIDGKKKQSEIREYSLSSHRKPPSITLAKSLPLPPHLNTNSKTRATPFPTYDRFYFLKDGRQVMMEERTSKSSVPSFSFSFRPPHPAEKNRSNSPDPATYNIPAILGNPRSQAVKGAGPAFSMGADVRGRSSTSVTHQTVIARQAPSSGILIVHPQKEVTRQARKHPGYVPQSLLPEEPTFQPIFFTKVKGAYTDEKMKGASTSRATDKPRLSLKVERGGHGGTSGAHTAR